MLWNTYKKKKMLKKPVAGSLSLMFKFSWEMLFFESWDTEVFLFHLIILEMFPKISFSFTVKGNYYYFHAATLMHDTNWLSGVLSFHLVFVLFWLIQRTLMWDIRIKL